MTKPCSETPRSSLDSLSHSSSRLNGFSSSHQVFAERKLSGLAKYLSRNPRRSLIKSPRSPLEMNRIVGTPARLLRPIAAKISGAALRPAAGEMTWVTARVPLGRPGAAGGEGRAEQKKRLGTGHSGAAPHRVQLSRRRNWEIARVDEIFAWPTWLGCEQVARGAAGLDGVVAADWQRYQEAGKGGWLVLVRCATLAGC